jgi:4-hydroxy-2-oxoheptanedioate aldolase
MAAAAGFDAVYVDLEHTAISMETTSLLCSGAIGAGITPLVHVPSHDSQYLTRALDVGAMGVIVPHVETRAEAEAVVDACYRMKVAITDDAQEGARAFLEKRDPEWKLR